MFKRWGVLRAAVILTLLLFSNEANLFSNEPASINLNNAEITLSGHWDYYKMVLHQPYEFYPIQKRKKGIPVTIPHKFEKGVSYATFHYRLENMVPNKYYAALMYGTIVSSSRIWCNGNLVATSGFLSKDKKDAKPGECPELIDLRADPNGVIDIMIHVANYEKVKGGILKPIKLTEKQTAIKNISIHYFFNAFLFIFLIAHIIHNGILSILTFKRRNHIILFILCILFSATTLLTGIALPQNIIRSIPYDVYRKLPTTLFCAEASFLILYETALFKLPYKRIALLHITSILNLLTSILLPIDLFEEFEVLFPGIALLCSMILLIIPAQFTIRKKINEHGISTHAVFIQNMKSILTFVIMVLCVCDFLLTPRELTTIHSYQKYKISILIFGIIQCGIYSFNRIWTVSRINRYSKILTDDNKMLSRFVSEQILKLLGASDVTKIIPGECRILDTIIFCAQIKHFSQLSETIERKELFSILHVLHQKLSPIIFDSGGFIAKNTSGGVIAIFQEKSTDAITCAARIQNKMKEIRMEARKRRGADIRVGISIHFGKIAIGTMGTQYRLDTTILSNDIDQACIVAKQTSKINANILITEEAMPYCRNYIDYMYEGHFFIMNGKQILVYSAVPIVKKDDAYEETLEALEEEDEV